ncbi:TPA: hypothetical protein PTX05_003934 [Cronobacter sakazakii]|nr:hypothetical protein [Cronobacter sakazakii]
MRILSLFLLIISVNAYADIERYCDLFWGIPKFQAQSFKKVGELEYDLVIKTDPNMYLRSRINKNMYPWLYTPVDGIYTYWVSFQNGFYRLPNGISFEVISVDNNKTPNFNHAINAGNHTWKNGCTDLEIGGSMNWGESTNMTFRLKTKEPIPPGNYDFSNFSLPVKIFYEENKGFYTGNLEIMRKEMSRALFSSVDNWRLEIKAPTCSHNQPSLDFGQMTYEQAKAGVSISKDLSLFCKDNPVSVKLYFKDTHKTFSETACGSNDGQKNCRITIGDNDKQYIEFNNQYFSPSGNGSINIPIKAKFKSQNPIPGKFKDSVILVVDVN